jgi:hypothetical protein
MRKNERLHGDLAIDPDMQFHLTQHEKTRGKKKRRKGLGRTQRRIVTSDPLVKRT